MNEQETIDFTKDVIEDTMIRYMFELASEETANLMQQMIINSLFEIVDCDFEVDVNLYKDGNIRTSVALFWEDDDRETTVIRACYEDCPSINQDQESEKVQKDDSLLAFERAMEIV